MSMSHIPNMPAQMDLMSRTLQASSSSRATVAASRRRMRMSPDQLQSLQTLYDLHPNPDKNQRAQLAREIDVDVKTVNVWFQNKRRSMKKKEAAWTQAENSTRCQTHPMLRRNPSYSLDFIASARERKDSRPPLRPRPHVPNQADDCDMLDSDTESRPIYDLIPSSPTMPPSSPSAECRFFSGLPPNSKVKRTLEFACAKDRAGRRKRASLKKRTQEGRDWDVPALELDDGEKSGTDMEDLITPDTSLQSLSVPEDLLDRRSSKGPRAERRADEEAARALLAFHGA